jgi:hypothetical protein
LVRSIALQHITVRLRRIAAAAFVLLLLTEWGSHATFHINSPSGLTVVSAGEQHRDVPGHSLALCNDSGRRDRQQPNAAHDLIPGAGLSLSMPLMAPAADAVEAPMPARATGELSRPPDPHFRPPKAA